MVAQIEKMLAVFEGLYTLQQELVCKDHNYDKQIMTPLQLYEWTSQAIPSINFVYCTIEQSIPKGKAVLENRFQKSQTIPGTQSLHSSLKLRKSCTY